MITEQDKFEEIVYDLNELSCETDCPVRLARLAIKEILDPVIGECEEAYTVHFAIGEMLKDIETHGDINGPRLIRIHHEIGGFVIDTFNKIDNKPSEYENSGIGRVAIQKIFGENFSFTDNGRTYRNHLFIPDDSLEIAS